MKSINYLWMTCVCIPLFCVSLVSCSNDDDDDNISTSPITLYAGSTATIDGNVNNAISSDEFVATVEKNTVTGVHVGEAYVTVNSKNKIPVTVQPKYRIMDDPITEWGASKSTIKQKQTQGKILKETEDILAYENCGDAEMVGYSFKSGKLAGIVVMMPMSKMSAYINYLKERFAFIPEQFENYTFLGFDAYTLEKSKTVAALSIYNTDYLSCVYMPTADYKKSSKVPRMDLRVVRALSMPQRTSVSPEMGSQLEEYVLSR